MLTKEQFRKEMISICKGARLVEGLTQKQMAEKIVKLGGYVSEASISQFESGGNNSMYMIYYYLMACKELDCSWHYIPEWLKEVDNRGKTDES